MRRIVLPAVLLAVLCGTPATGRLMASSAPAQEQTAEKAGGPDEAPDDAMSKWKLINTGIFALLLGFALVRLAPKFFNARSADIQQAIREATGLKMDADFRYSEMDKKMANLSKEVARLRTHAQAQMERQHQRVLSETAEEVDHIRKNAEAEIFAMQKEGERQVRLHTAQLALGLAERRLQAYFANDDDANNIRDFVDLVARGNN